MLEQQLEEPVAAELVLIEIGSGEIERLEVEVDAKAIEVAVKRRLNSLIHLREREREARDRRRAAAERLEFPFFRPRPGQDAILEGVERALDQREHLLIEAPTGLGKTVAALYPVLKHALAHDQRVFVLTAKTLQQEMAGRVLELLNRDGAFHSLRLRAKARMCANDEVLCHEEYCPWAKDYYAKLHRTQVVERLLEGDPNLRPDTVFELARDSEVCPFEVSLELGQRVQVMVCDYNYAFAPFVSLSDFGPDADLSDTVLVIDEIHNLVDRGRGYYSPELEAERCREVARATLDAVAQGRGDRALAGRIQALCLALAQRIEESVEEVLPPEGDGALEARLPEDELLALRPEFDRAFVDYLEHRRDTRSFRADDPFVDLYFDLLRFLGTLQRSHGPGFSHCVLREDGRRRIQVLCLDASPFLGEVVNRCHSTLGLSATLSPSEFYRDLLGFDPERTSSLSVGSPFPPEHRALVIDSSVTTTWRQRSANYEPIAERLAEFADAVPGNCLALFPSYRFLDEVHRRMPEIDRRIFVQRRRDNEGKRQELLETLRGALLGDVLLLAVAGGVFAEGVDYPGDMLRAVAVVGPCLPTVSLERKLLEAYYEERFARGFEYAFVIPGMTRVVQAAGRLIRSAQDTGVIALFDRRFAVDPYARQLPAEWLEGGGVSSLCGHPASVALGFFEQLEVVTAPDDVPPGRQP
jgi:DNA excision repair protein ERCC-2